MATLVTGAIGLLGRHLIPVLQERGYHIRSLVLPEEDASWLVQNDVQVFRGDVRRPETLVAPIQGVETVFHLAGMIGMRRSVSDYHNVNVVGTENVCRAALAWGVRRLVHVSFWTVYGMALGRPATEDFPFAPFNEPHAITKAAGDRVVQRLIERERFPAVIIRPGTFFGPGDRLHFARIADRLRARKGIIVGSGANALPFVDVSDVVHGLVLAAEVEGAVGDAYNITNDQPLTQERFLQAVAAEIRCRPPRRHVPLRLLSAAAFAAERISDVPGRSGAGGPPLTRLDV
jgi:dihydroflavonol-4-reductase